MRTVSNDSATHSSAVLWDVRVDYVPMFCSIFASPVSVLLPFVALGGATATTFAFNKHVPWFGLSRSVLLELGLVHQTNSKARRIEGLLDARNLDYVADGMSEMMRKF